MVTKRGVNGEGRAISILQLHDNNSEAASRALGWLHRHAGPDRRRLPDSQELTRLEQAASGETPVGWRAWFDPGYGYFALPADGPGDLCPNAGAAPDDLVELLGQAGVFTVDVWVRDLTLAHPAMNVLGVDVLRRLVVLELPVDAWSSVPEPVDAPPIERLADVDVDVDALARLLTDAYVDTPDAWSRERILAELERGDVNPDDVLIVRSQQEPDELDGVHWTMMRNDSTGEVHNLAVHPRVQRGGLARYLLDAGIEYLGNRGCDRVLLWSDEANEVAGRLFASVGFRLAWVDALLRVPLT